MNPVDKILGYKIKNKKDKSKNRDAPDSNTINGWEIGTTTIYAVHLLNGQYVKTEPFLELTRIHPQRGDVATDNKVRRKYVEGYRPGTWLTGQFDIFISTNGQHIIGFGLTPQIAAQKAKKGANSYIEMLEEKIKRNPSEAYYSQGYKLSSKKGYYLPKKERK